MKHYSYREQDHVFGQAMLRLRMAIGLTQVGLAHVLHVSRRAVGGWEAGQSYPKVGHLKQFIGIALAQQAFAAGREAEEIRDLWHAAHQKLLLDETWLETLLAKHNASLHLAPVTYSHGATTPSEPATRSAPLLDWGDALVVPSFYGRAMELAQIEGWLVAEPCRVVSVLGMDGVGKSALATQVMRQVTPHFQAVIWRSLRDAPSCEALIASCLEALAPAPLAPMPTVLDDHIRFLMDAFHAQRVLLVLDNCEAVLDATGRMRPGFEGYTWLLQRMSEPTHTSCLLLTSRAALAELTPQADSCSIMRALHLTGLDAESGAQLLAEKNIIGGAQEQKRLIDRYQGNPLALKIVAQTILDLFGGDIASFLAQGTATSRGVRALLDAHFRRLSVLDRTVVAWLAMLREPASLAELLAVLHTPHAAPALGDAIDRLSSRSLIARGQRAGTFTLQSVVLDYATARLVEEASDAIVTGQLARLVDHSLCQADAKAYVRQTQEQSLVLPTLTRLRSRYQGPDAIEARLIMILDHVRSWPQMAQGYAPANLVALLRLLRGHLRGIDLSGLALRGLTAYDIEMQDARLADTLLQPSVFAAPRDASFAVSTNEQLWASASLQGEMQVLAAGHDGAASLASAALRRPHAEQQANTNPMGVHNLPFQPTTFIGRAAELTAITQRLRDPSCRLLTLFGPGGIGKTRLALQAAAAHAPACADGVVFVALAPVDSSSQIVSAINDTLGLLPGEHPDPTTLLLSYLRERHMLLVLDNFEHLREGADLVAALLAHAPNLSILVTSRERLHVQAEWLFDVGGLAYPQADHDGRASLQRQPELAAYSAVQLFVQRALQVQPALVLDHAAMLSITRICQHVAGMPLAIELAAAGTYIRPLAEIEHHIRTNMDVLETTLRDVPPRHRSLRAVFAHSWKLLDDHERAVFSRLAVFRGGWSAHAAAEVAGATLPVLAALIDKSLVRHSGLVDTTHQEARAPRWIMLESLREYALEQLQAQSEAAACQQAHACYFVALAESVAAQWGTATFEQAIALLRREYDNIRAALAWARDSGDVLGLRLAEALWQFWRSYGYVSEGRAWLEQLLALDLATTDQSALSMRQRALHAAAWLASDQHDYAEATRLFEASAALRHRPDQINLDTDVLLNAARQARTEGEYSRAAALLEQALAWHRAQGHSLAKGSMPLDVAQQTFGQVLREYGLVTREQGKFAHATALFQESLAFHQAVGDRACAALALIGLADIARDQGNGEGVQEYGDRALPIVRELGMPWAIGFTLNTLALGAYYRGEFAQAGSFIRESEAIFRDLHADGSTTEILITAGKIARAQGDMAAATTAMSKALQMGLAIGPRLFVAVSLEGLGSITAAQGQAEASVRLLALAAALRRHMGAPLWPADQASLDAALAIVQALLDTQAYTDTLAEVQVLPLDQLLQTIAALEPMQVGQSCHSGHLMIPAGSDLQQRAKCSLRLLGEHSARVLTRLA